MGVKRNDTLSLTIFFCLPTPTQQVVNLAQQTKTLMGLRYRQYLQQEGGKKVYGCLKCQSHLAIDDMIVSKELNGQQGPGYLFEKV